MTVKPLLAACLVAASSPALADQAAIGVEAPPPHVLPDLARAMIDAAAESGEAYQVHAVGEAAKRVFPEHVTAIEDYSFLIASAVLENLMGSDSELLIVRAETEEEEAPEGVSDEVGEVELRPGRAPEWLKLGPWTGGATASGLVSSGNSENAAFGLAFNANREISYFKHNIKAYVDYGTAAGVKSQQRWGASYQLDYTITDNTYGYARLQYDEDEFTGFDYRLFSGLGVGHFIFQGEPVSWKVEGGPGYQYAPVDDTREVDQHVAVYGSTEVDWLIRDGLKFEQDVRATWTDPTSTIFSRTALTTSLTDTLSAGVSFDYRYETNPPTPRIKTDTTFRANLNYGF